MTNMPDFAQPHCFYIPSDQGPEADELGYIPSLVFANESGHFPMAGDETQAPWRWGPYEQARKIAEQENDRLGISPRRAALIIAASMNLQTARL